MADIQAPKIVFEDGFIILVEKPAGMVTTREAGSKQQATGNISIIKNNTKEQKYLEDWVEGYFPNNLPRRGIVHRLDKGTSGLVLIAKDNDSLTVLKKQFKNRSVKKNYLALVCGDLPQNGSVVMPIGRSRYMLQKFSVRYDGKPAVTEFSLVKKLRIGGKLFSLVEVNLKTGRTHQIRVHFNYLGWPLAGDQLYGAKDNLGLSRPFLHARYIKFNHPESGKIMEFDSGLPVDLSSIISNAAEY